MLRFCPHCSCKLDEDQIIEWGGWTFDEGLHLLKPGNIRFTRQEALIISAILRKQGNVARKKDVLYAAVCAGREASDDIPEVKIVDVVVSKIRRRMRERAGLFMIETVWSEGYRALQYDPEKCISVLRNALPHMELCDCGHFAKSHSKNYKHTERRACRYCPCTKFNRMTT
jgi:DNA-binding winged helix-turn-helix (wHTH) protein